MAEYTINVNFNGDETEGYESNFATPQELSGGSGSGGNQSNLGATGTPTTTDGSKALKGFAKVWGASALVRETFQWSLNVANRGSSVAQDKINSAFTIASQAVGFGLAAASGGPVGAALAGTAIILSYAKEIDQNSYAKKWENTAIQETLYRAGASFNRSRSN